MGKKIGFVSTRFSGTDGVTLEASKWATVLKQSGHECFWFCGESDRDPQTTMVVADAHFKDINNKWINDRIWGRKGRDSIVTNAIHDMRSLLKKRLKQFLTQFDIDLLIVENALAIPMQLPFGLAITEVIAETQIPTIAHHHDFYWERDRYSVNAVAEYLRMAFPPSLHSVAHVVINSLAQEELAHRKGIASIIIPNVLDFGNPPVADADQTGKIRAAIGLDPGDIMILQPTRVVARKGIEHAIDLVRELRDPRYKLVISHEAGDEGLEYQEWLKENAKSLGVDLRFMNMKINDPGNVMENGENHVREGYSLWDIYPHADFITYPSLYEGFGNAFLEAIYFKKPLLINRYAIFVKDIEPRGFDLIVMDGYLKSKTIESVRHVLESPQRRTEMVNTNYDLAMQYYSFSVLRKRLNYLLDHFFGVNG
jgi:glycosyltransferase involved in cell wall biosynthesis